MKLIFSSNNRHFLELYEPEVTFLRDAYLAETEELVKATLEEEGLTKDDFKKAGIKIMKNKITIPAGTKAEVISMKDFTEFKVKDIYFSSYFTFESDLVVMEVKPLNPEFERVFGQYAIFKDLPKREDNTILYGYNLLDVIDAVANYHKDMDRLEALELLKVTPRQDVERMIRMYEVHQELERLD